MVTALPFSRPKSSSISLSMAWSKLSMEIIRLDGEPSLRSLNLRLFKNSLNYYGFFAASNIEMPN